MEKFKWNVPVVLSPSPQIAKERIICDARDAAHVLILEWPWTRGWHHDNALRACALVLGGFIEPDAARTWLVRAAREAYVEIGTNDDIDGLHSHPPQMKALFSSRRG